MPRRYHVIVNARSGTALGMDLSPEALRQHFSDALDEADIAIDADVDLPLAERVEKAKASDAEITALMRATGKIARDAGVADTGYRLLFNHGPDSHQEVPHLHIHILGGRLMGPLVVRKD